MTPEARAARDRIAAYLDALTERKPEQVIDYVMVRSQSGERAYDRLDLAIPDLRTVLAALDTPCAFITCEHILTEQAAEDLKRRFLAAQHDGTIRILDEPERAACAVCGRPIQYLDHPGWPIGWMHILEAADHEARPADNPA